VLSAANVTPMFNRHVRAGTAAPSDVPTPLMSLQRAMRAADADGFARGERAGYLGGWRWGLVCGICLGLTLGATLVAGALYLGVTL
jgi:hypothetical protein